MVEIQDWDTVAVHRNVAEVVDSLLRGFPAPAEIRHRREDGQIERWVERDYFGGGLEKRHAEAGRRVLLRKEERPPAVREEGKESAPPPPDTPLRIYPFGVNRKRLARAARLLQVPVALVDELAQAQAVVTLQGYYRRSPRRLREAEEAGVPIYVLKTNTAVQMENCLHILSERRRPLGEDALRALQETEEAIRQVLSGEQEAVELAPQNAYIRRLQHQMIERYRLASASHGQEPKRRVRIFRRKEKEDPCP